MLVTKVLAIATGIFSFGALLSACGGATSDTSSEDLSGNLVVAGDSAPSACPALSLDTHDRGIEIQVDSALVSYTGPYKKITLQRGQDPARIVVETPSYSPMGSGATARTLSPTDADYAPAKKELTQSILDWTSQEHRVQDWVLTFSSNCQTWTIRDSLLDHRAPGRRGTEPVGPDAWASEYAVFDKALRTGVQDELGRL